LEPLSNMALCGLLLHHDFVLLREGTT